MKVLKNYAYNLSYQILLILLPIITTPYITRIFTSDDLGAYGYYNSLVTYFILLATLGSANYGTKQISGNREEIRETFWGIFNVQLLSSGLSVLIYALACVFVPGMQNPIAYILLISLLAKVFDISWLFQGLEDFKKITVRNVLIKLLGVSSVFVFVKTEHDLYLYIFLIASFELLGQVIMWWPAREYIGSYHYYRPHIRGHIRPIILLFLPQVAISLYVTLDRTMLGLLSTTKDVGIYDQALKLLNILLTLVTSLGTVMLPRIAHLLSIKDEEGARKMHEHSFLIYNLVIFPTIAGVLIVNDDFVSFFLGADFQLARHAIAIMVLRMFFIGWTNIMGIQILIPHDKNREFMLSTTIPAFVSVGLNLLLIPSLGYIGASITAVLTEALVWAIQLYFTRDYLKQVAIVPNMLKIILASGLMFVLLFLLKPIISFSPVVNVVIFVALGTIIYGLVIYLLKVIRLKELMSFIKK